MKRLFGKSLALLLAVLCTVMLMAPALAADADSVTIAPTVTITATGNVPEAGETMTIVVQPEEAGSPMPEGTDEDGNYYLEVGPVKVDEETNVAYVESQFEITYTEPGHYYYLISQESGTDIERGNYDETVYRLEVLVKYSTDGNLYAEVALTDANGDPADKKDAAAFENSYDEVFPSTSPEDPDEPTENPVQPDEPEPSTTGDVYDDPTEPEPVTPDEPDTVDITEEEVPLDDAEEPTVEIEDEGVPQNGVTIEDEGVPQGGVTIDDEGVPLGSLPQTGQLWWPVLLMLCLGVALLAGAGVNMHMTKRNNGK